MQFQTTNQPQSLASGLKVAFEVSRYPISTFGQYLRKLRLERGLLQKELARLLSVDEMSVVNWEKDRPLQRRSLKKLVDLFEIAGPELIEYGNLFNRRQHKLIERIKERGEVPKREYQEMWTVSRRAIQYDLRDLLELGVLKRGKRGRLSYYSLERTPTSGPAATGGWCRP